MFLKRIIGLLILSACLVQARATVVLPKILGNGMVLQQKQFVPIWGAATPGEKVTVTFKQQTKTTTTDADGNWQVMLSPLVASADPAIMTISGTNTIQLTNILVGEVWLASGQSNMQYEMRKNSKVKKPDTSTVNSPVDELERAHNPQIRIFLVTQKNLRKPDSLHTGWDIAEDSALRNFNAAGYFFAKNLQARLKVPVGIISSAISGSRIEPWAPKEAFDQVSYFKEQDYKIEGEPGKFYNTMIAPLAPFAISGFLWYQGESNCFLGETISYTYKMEALINNWRSTWHNLKLPFYYVQIVPYYYSKATGKVPYTAETLPKFWEAQTAALAIPHTGMIVTTDLNDDIKNLHPPFKWEVGRRLALLALKNTYGQKQVVASGPVYQKMNIKGQQAILKFKDEGTGLVSHDGKPLSHFTIAGADSIFYPATATIEGDKVVVSAPQVSKPVAVRFAWAEDAQPNFYNKEGLPTRPFRTDNPLQFKP
ncbi:sialate O-acetylesterase [Mucilaginibacter sp. RS28]|uniref:Sialate O-acetylesterase n=1 Tax=Mucilaginibacter straminoryzae TaxID=2932774 RepID=A0A9X2B8V4_9SPHI|nr:sialate O-acetylesterase [Mucilaginibacter straminoryzae]MCJ8210014.1 sialate O-acetylesterase [Mucilaginibacter straminoryzae]